MLSGGVTSAEASYVASFLFHLLDEFLQRDLRLGCGRFALFLLGRRAYPIGYTPNFTAGLVPLVSGSAASDNRAAYGAFTSAAEDLAQGRADAVVLAVEQRLGTAGKTTEGGTTDTAHDCAVAQRSWE